MCSSRILASLNPTTLNFQLVLSIRPLTRTKLQKKILSIDDVSMGSEKANGRMYAEAFIPFRVEKGTCYPSMSQGTIDFHRASFFRRRNKGPFASPMEATQDILWQNDNRDRIRSLPEIAAISRLQTTIYNIRYKGATYGPDLAVKAFSDLDIIFFAGMLGRNVCVNWSSHKFNPHLQFAAIPWATVWGVSVENQHPSEFCQCRIILNAGSLFSAKVTHPLQGMMATLLHEMCHAYDIVRCVPTAERCGGDGLGHDEHFETRLVAVHERAMRVMGLGAISEGEPFRQRRFSFTNAIARD